MNEPWQKIIKTPAFWLVGIALGIGLLLIMGFASDVSLLAQNLFGVDSKQGAFVYMIYALTTGVGGFLIGGAADKIGPMRAWMITSAITAVFVFALVLSGLSSYVFFVIVVAWVGIAGGATTTLMPTVLMPAFGVKTFGVNFGLFGIVMVTASLLGSQMSVSMDTSKFLIIGAIGSLAAIVLSLVAVKAVNKYHGFKVLK
jgi:OFA family oxalate/formate antiporter-like MFS transporter